jgi:hypothetical protein
MLGDSERDAPAPRGHSAWYSRPSRRKRGSTGPAGISDCVCRPSALVVYENKVLDAATAMAPAVGHAALTGGHMAFRLNSFARTGYVSGELNRRGSPS